MSYVLEHEVTTELAFYHVVCVGCFRVFVVVIATFYLIDTWGRRPLMITSIAGVVLAHIYLALAYHWQLDPMPWKIGGFYFFMTFYEIGIGPVAYVYMAECLDNE